MARFTHPAISSTASTDTGTWTVEGGTLETQPTFSGTPMFSGGWVKTDHMVHFSIDVQMDNITFFGTGQYYVKLPFPAKYNYLMSDGCLHDNSTGNEYAILGHVQANSDILTLLTVTSNGGQNPFADNIPIKLAVEDSFHIAGNYQSI
jgi:hypothetical protein